MKVKFLMKKIGEKKVLLPELNNKEIADRVGHFLQLPHGKALGSEKLVNFYNWLSSNYSTAPT